MNQGFPVFIVAPSGEMFEHILDFAIKLLDLGAELIVISDNQEILKLGKVIFSLPKGIPEWSKRLESMLLIKIV